jgi:hypothetical protein
MEHGDLSNEAPKRLWIVFEGLLAQPVQPQRARRRRLLSARPPEPRPEHYALDTRVVDVVARLQHHTSYHLETVTWLGGHFAQQLDDWLLEQAVHLHAVAADPIELARRIAHRPDITRIYDPDRDHVLTFGARGVHCPPNAAHDTIGVL